MNDITYITTAIPYVNGRPHIGFALELVQADVIARYNRLIGNTTKLQTGTDENAFKNVTCHFLIISISSDWLFPVSQQLDIVSALITNRKKVSYFQLESPYGHDAFLIEYDTLGCGIDAFLNGKLPEGLPTLINRIDLDFICNMIDDGMHVLDVGSGGGETMWALKDMKKFLLLNLLLSH